MYFDDLPTGFTFTTTARALSLDDIVTFAKMYDPQPFHIDPIRAEKSIYGGIIASGFQTMIVAFALTLEANIWNESSMGSPGMDDVRWKLPVRPDDTIHVRGSVVASNASKSRDDRGRTEILYEIINQNDEIVAHYTAIQLLKRKPK